VVRRAGLTLAGNRRARRVLVEAAWSYRHPARVSETLRPGSKACRSRFATSPGTRRSGSVPAIAASAPPARKLPVVIATIAREMAAFLSAIARQVAPAA
jgi:hypothetical protein